MKMPPDAVGSRRQGFTLVEIMIVVVIIGLLAALAIPAIGRIRSHTQNNRFVNDLRIMSYAFNAYEMEHGAWPADGNPGVAVPEMDGYLAGVDWTAPTAIGGLWDWDYQTFGVTAGISVYLPTISAVQLQEIDAKIDDGNLSTGRFRRRTNGYIFVLRE